MVQLKTLMNEGGLFAAINSTGQFPFITDNETLLDDMLVIKYGEKTVHRPYEEMTLEHIAQTLVLNNRAKWLSYIEMESIGNNPYSETVTNEATTNTEDRTSNREDVNKVAAFNDDELLDNDGSNSESVDNSVNTGSKESTRTEKNKLIAWNLLNETSRDTIIIKVLKDVASSITLDIY